VTSVALTPEQKQAVVELKYTPGWPLLLDALQARIDWTADRLDAEEDGPKALRILAKWQALREVAALLKWTPEALAEDLEEEARAKEPDGVTEETASPSAKAQILATLRRYHELREAAAAQESE